MNLFLRFMLLIAYLPSSLIVGMLVSGTIATLIPVWDQYIAAVLLPFMGIVGAWLIMPKYRIAAAVTYFVIGVTLAYMFAFPSFYPEGHELAYQDTYLPFILTVLVGLTCLITLVVTDRLRSTKDSTE